MSDLGDKWWLIGEFLFAIIQVQFIEYSRKRLARKIKMIERGKLMRRGRL